MATEQPMIRLVTIICAAARAKEKQEFDRQQLTDKLAQDNAAGRITQATVDAGFDVVDWTEPRMPVENVDIWMATKRITGSGNVYLHGPPGIGKTLLARCALVQARKNGMGIAEVAAPEFVRRAGSFDVYDKEKLAAWTWAGLLLLDDIDKAQWNARNAGFLWSLLDSRANQGRTTIITSNLPREKFKQVLMESVPGNTSLAVGAMDRLEPCYEARLTGKGSLRKGVL